MIGVHYNDFWGLNPHTLEPFIEAFSLTQKQYDSMMWTMGGYIQLAIGSTLSKKVEYPKKPFSHRDSELEMRRKIMKRMEQIRSQFKGR